MEPGCCVSQQGFVLSREGSADEASRRLSPAHSLSEERSRMAASRSCLCVCVCALLSFQLADSLEFYPYGPAYDLELPKRNDVSSLEIPLTVPIRFFGVSYDSIFVNSNGLLSFLTEIPMFFSIQFPLNYPVIAPLYANVDTSARGQVFYRQSQDPALLQRFNDRVSRFYPRLPQPFSARNLLIASWLEVGYFPNGADKVNTFQVVVGSDGTDTFVELLYRQGGVQWVQGRNEGTRLPDARAQAGFVAEDGRLYTLRGSGTDQIQNLDRWTNTDEPGAWLFRVGDTGSEGNVEPPQAPAEDIENLIEEASCQSGATMCHSRAECIDNETGYCCVCSQGFYGNGRTCLPDQIPQRLNGKIKMGLNGSPEQEVDVQAYVVTADGRCYTALSGVPPAVGTDAQLVTSVADVIGWLFAKSIDNSPNGYILTGGVLNHTATLTFTNSAHRVTVDQHFLGLDVYDQLRMEGRITGSLPQVPHGFKLTLPDTQVQFRKVSKGEVQSHNTYVVYVEGSVEQFPVTVEQSITFTEFCPLPSSSDATLRLKAARSFISYEETEHILRFASTNKISSLSDNDDPCVVGQVSCVNNSYCIPDGSTFRCVCKNGFQTLYSDDTTGDYGCVDINECQSGSHSCHENALCINEVGSFSCQCRPGFNGDGHSCQSVSPQDCSSISCGPGAECVESAESGPRCYCIPGFKGDGITCTPNAEDDCLTCSPHAFCNHSQSGSVECTCLPGYQGNGRECSLAEDTKIRVCLLGACWCPSGYRDQGTLCIREESFTAPPHKNSSSSEQEQEYDPYQYPVPECYSPNRCYCPKGFALKETTCVPEATASLQTHFTKGHSGNSLSCNTYNNCHPQAQCIFLTTRGSYECQCNSGFEGDGYDCSEVELSCREADICHLYATCEEEENSDRAICVCYKGYQGDGTMCQKIDMCSDDASCGDHASCVWSDDSLGKDCECDPGYVLDYKICVKQGCEECHKDADCVNSIAGIPQCVCRSGLVGDGVERCESQPTGCNLLNNCAREAECVFVSSEIGYRCQCRQGYEGSGLECHRNNNCQDNPEICNVNAQCIPSPAGHECKCKSGYVGNGQTCKEMRQREGDFLLVNKGMATVKIPQEPTKANPGRPIQLQYDQIAIGLAVDCVEGVVYWSDITNHLIKKSSLNGKDITNFVEKDVDSPEGLAVDWINRKLYWTDSSKDVIRAASLETGETETVISTDLVNPRGITVHPTRRRVYWSDWNRFAPKLESANLDGSSRSVLVSEGIQLPNSLAIDWNTEELCWTDAGTKKIECIGLESRVRRTVVPNCTYPFGLTITDDKYYWTDWSTQKVESAFKYSTAVSDSLNVPLGGSGRLYGIAAVSDNCPRV